MKTECVLNNLLKDFHMPNFKAFKLLKTDSHLTNTHAHFFDPSNATLEGCTLYPQRGGGGREEDPTLH